MTACTVDKLRDGVVDNACNQNTSLPAGKGPRSQRHVKDAEHAHLSLAEKSAAHRPHFLGKCSVNGTLRQRAVMLGSLP